MSYIQENENIQNRIISHSHFNSCLFGDDYQMFYQTFEKLNKINNCYENVIILEKELIDECNNKLNKENELNNIIELTKEIYNNERRNLDNKIEINQKKNECNINIFENEFIINELRQENEINQLDQDIFNLKEEIQELKEKFNSEIDIKKKEIINKLSNKYKIKLLQYLYQKEIEKQMKENEMLIKKHEFETKKEIELNELKNKAELVKRIIAYTKLLIN